MPEIRLPRHVHRVRSRGRDYFYYQPGRGSNAPGPRVRLPDDPTSPEFWAALRAAQGAHELAPVAGTVAGLIDAYVAAWPTLQRPLSPGTQDQYRRYLAPIREKWGHLDPHGLRPRHVDALIRSIGVERPGAANNTLDALRAMFRWALGPVELVAHDPTRGVRHFPKGAGHAPWTDEQLAFAAEHFTGPLRRLFFLAAYTGQRVSDLVRLGPQNVEDGCIRLTQKKSGARPWAPIWPELEAEMATWERRPGPFLIQQEGRRAGHPFTTNSVWKLFDRERAKHPILEGAVLHGLRANAVIRLRRAGYSHAQIADMVGMSLPIVESYCRNEDKKASALGVLAEARERAATVKPLENGKRK